MKNILRCEQLKTNNSFINKFGGLKWKIKNLLFWWLRTLR